jgi:lipoprotein-releasing system permease protein
MEKIGSIIVLSLIILVASFNMVATLSLITIKKIKDIAILRVLGAKISDLRKVLFIQALIIGGGGGFIGILTGIGFIYLQNMFGFISLPSDIYAMDVLPMILSITDVLIVSLICFCFIIIPGWVSGKKVSKFDPIKALRWTK